MFIIDTDGSKVPLTELEFSLQVKAWVDVSCGALVFEKTRIGVDESK